MPSPEPVAQCRRRSPNPSPSPEPEPEPVAGARARRRHRNPNRTPVAGHSPPRNDAVIRELREMEEPHRPLAQVARASPETVEAPAIDVRDLRIGVPRFRPEAPAAKCG